VSSGCAANGGHVAKSFLKVWRDFNGDWGEDLLAEHYRNSPHHQHASVH
jgi:hypothetical protein